MPIKVFYAWQLDRDKQVCRQLIKKAAQRAVKLLSADAEIKSSPAIDLDEATKGVSGHPHIAATIRRKIKSCDVFLADLTHVAAYTTTDGRPKKSPNPNVLIELGMAIKAKGFTRLVLVMNHAFGPPDELPFDLKSHSFPITYALAESADRAALKEAEEGLAKAIAGKLKPMLREIEADAGDKARRTSASLEAGQREHGDKAWAWFEQHVAEGQFHSFNSDGSYLTFALIPLAFNGDVALHDIQNVYESLPSIRSASHKASRADHVRVFRLAPANEQGHRPVEAVVALYTDGRILSAQGIERQQFEGDAHNSVDYSGAERCLVSHTREYLKLLRRLAVTGPIRAQFSLHRVNGCQLITGRVAFLHGPFELADQPDITPRPVVIPDAADGSDQQAIATVLRPALDWMWRQVGAQRCPYFKANGQYDFDAAGT